MRVLAAVDTVHTAAAICDYLDDRLDADDEVVGVGVQGSSDADTGPLSSGDDGRDVREALNVLGVRLALPSVEAVERSGDPANEILAVAEAHDVDEIVLGTRAGTPDAEGNVGSTTEVVVSDAAVPVVVLPSVGV